MANYMDGPYLKFPKGAVRSVTFQQLQDSCVSAQAELGDGYVLQPEAITEGGICFVDWPGKRGDGYKTVRFINLGGPWPELRDGEVFGSVEYIAKTATSTFGPERGNSLYTLLKAFYGAPVFTTTELQAVMSSLASCYEGCKIVRMPSNSKLQRNFKDNKHSNIAKSRSYR